MSPFKTSLPHSLEISDEITVWNLVLRLEGHRVVLRGEDLDYCVYYAL